MQIVANTYTATDDGRGVTASSLETWQGTRAMFGRFVEIRLGHVLGPVGEAYARSDDGELVRPSMTLTDDQGRVLALSGVSCGYDGTGPRGAAQILAAEGFLDADVALRVVTADTGVALRRARVPRGRGAGVLPPPLASCSGIVVGAGPGRAQPGRPMPAGPVTPASGGVAGGQPVSLVSRARWARVAGSGSGTRSTSGVAASVTTVRWAR